MRATDDNDPVETQEWVDSLRAVLHEAEEQAGETLREIVVTLSGGTPRSTRSSGGASAC